jgi:hypothetical protein
LTWEAWAGLCVLVGTLFAPMVFFWLAGGTALLYLAWPARYVWAWSLGRPVMSWGWLPVRPMAAALLSATAGLGLAILGDLAGLWSLAPAWFLALEAWQMPIYPWVAHLPAGRLLERPAYLWALCGWTLVEGAIATAALLRVKVRAS